MIRSHRVLAAPELGAVHEVTAWLERDARIHTTRSVGMVCDDRFFQSALARNDALGRALATVIVGGCEWMETPEGAFRLEVGDGVVLPSKQALLARTEGEPYLSIIVEWVVPEGVARPGLQRFRVADVDAMRALAERIHDAALPDPDVARELIDAMRAAGPQLLGLAPDATAALAPKESRFQELADAIDATLEDMRGQPMTRDLEEKLGLSSRQMTRLVEAYNERYGLGGMNWLATRNRRRLLLAASFLTCPRATVAAIADLVGYRRPETMARAFSNAGYPPPSRVRDTVRELAAVWEEKVRAS